MSKKEQAAHINQQLQISKDNRIQAADLAIGHQASLNLVTVIAELR